MLAFYESSASINQLLTGYPQTLITSGAFAIVVASGLCQTAINADGRMPQCSPQLLIRSSGSLGQLSQQNSLQHTPPYELCADVTAMD